MAALRRRWSGLDGPGRREVLILLLLLLAYGYFQQQPSWNENSRYDLTRAIVEEQTLKIDSFHENTGDKARHDGHWYSDKAPGTALLAVPVYALLAVVGWLSGNGPPAEVEAVQALAFFESAIPTVILVLLLVRYLRPLVGEPWAITVGLAYAFGSMAFPFATLLFGHAAAAAALFASFYLLKGLRTKPGGGRAITAGVLAGLAVLIEIPAALGVAVLGVYALWIGPRIAAGFIAGGLPLALVFGAYNRLAFGDYFSIGYANLAPGGFASGMNRGIFGVTWPKAETLVELLIGPRGLVRLAPWFALAPLGIVALRRRGIRAEVVVCVAIVALFLLYNAGYYLPLGGATPGPRFLVPALPFAAVLVALAPRSARYLAVPLMLIGIGIAAAATATEPKAWERFDDPITQVWLPMVQSGAFASTGPWIRWGMPTGPSIIVLILAAALALAALATSLRQSAVGERLATRAPIVLAAMLLLFALPLPSVSPVRSPIGADASPEMAVAELTATRLLGARGEEVELRARIDNRGGGVSDSRVTFLVWTADGDFVWGRYYDAVALRAGARPTISMTWLPEDVPAGPYRFGVRVTDAATDTVYAERAAPATFTIGG